MISSVNSSLSALNAAEKRLEVSAHNVANVNTDEYKSQEASVSEGKHGGVKVTISQSTQPGTKYDRGDGEIVESSNVDYVNEAVNQMSAKAMYSANLTSLKSYEENYSTLIDIMV